MSPDPELSLQKRAYTTEDLFCGTRFPQRLDNCLQCSSDTCACISEPKYTRNTRQPNTRIRVCIYAHTCRQYSICAYALLVCMSLPIVSSILIRSLFLATEQEQEKVFIILNTRIQYTRVSLQTRLSKMLAETNILQLGTLTVRKL